MAKKSFKTAPQAKQPTADQLAFVKGGAGTDKSAPKKRVSFDVPEELHTRFKVACAKSQVRMTPEILAFIEKRTAELEKLSV